MSSHRLLASSLLPRDHSHLRHLVGLRLDRVRNNVSALPQSTPVGEATMLPRGHTSQPGCS